jgi:hypothetical protein
VNAGNDAFWDELVLLCEWAFTDQGEYYLQQIGDADAWVFQVDEDLRLTCWRARLSLDYRWTLSPVY